MKDGMRRRIGFLIDFMLFRCGGEIRSDDPMVRFVQGFLDHFERISLIARVFPSQPSFEAPYVVPGDRIDIHPLPPYPQISALYTSPLRYWSPISGAIDEALPQLDALWLNFGHPVSYLALRRAEARGSIRLFGALRGDYERDAALRARGPRLVKAAARRIMALQMILFARRFAKGGYPCFAFGADLARRLEGRGVRAHTMADSLITGADLDRDVRPDSSLETDLLAVGRLTPEKGFEVLLEALARTTLPGGARPRLRLVGSGPLADPLKVLASRLGLAQRVTFDGHVAFGPELFARYRSARVFVISSLTEGLPKTAYEAMAFGCPVLATNVGGLPEIIGAHGERGRLVPPGDPVALAETATEMLSDPAQLERMAARATAYGRTFTLERQVEQIMRHLYPEAPPGGQLRA